MTNLAGFRLPSLAGEVARRAEGGRGNAAPPRTSPVAKRGPPAAQGDTATRIIAGLVTGLVVVGCGVDERTEHGGGKGGQRAAVMAAGMPAQKALDEAMAVDREFSAYAQTHPMGEAFAAYMDAVEGMMIGPGDVTVGEEAIRAGFAGWPEDLKMSWEPDGGHGSASGDLAVTTGRYTRTRNDETVGTGRYVSVWKKNSSGEWKGVIDLGAPDPPPVQEDTQSPEE